MIACPNLNMSPFKEVTSAYGELAAYDVDQLFQTSEFKEWYGNNDLPLLDFKTFSVLNNKGEVWNIGKLLNSKGYIKTASKQDNSKKVSKENPGEVTNDSNVADLNAVFGKSKKKTSAKNVLSKIHNKMDDQLSNQLSYAMMDLVSETDDVIIEELEDGQYMGLDPETGTIHINENMLYDYSIETFSKIFLHELTHKYTATALDSPKTERERVFAFKIKELYRVAAKQLNKKDHYMFSDKVPESHRVHEFVAELMTNKKFQEAVKGLKLNIWQRFVNAMANLFGQSEGSTVYESAVNAILDQVNNYEFSAYHTPKGIHSSVKIGATKETADNIEEEVSEDRKRARKVVENVNKRIETLDDAVDAAIRNIQKKLNRNINKDNQKFTDNLKELKKQLEEYREKDSLKALLLFSERVLSQSDALSEKMKNSDNLDEAMLYDMHEFLAAYDLIPTIARQIRTHLPDGKEKEDVLRELSFIEGRRQEVLDQRAEIVEEKVAKLLAGESNIISGEYREKYEREANKLGYKDQTKIDHINKRMEDSKVQIEKESQKYFRDLVSLTPSDIGSLEAYIYDPGLLNSLTVSAVVNIFNRADLEVRKFTMANKKEMYDLYKEYSKDHPDGNQRKKYDKLISVDKNGKHIGAFTSEYRYDFYLEHEKLLSNYTNALHDFGKDSPEHKARKKDLNTWTSANTSYSTQHNGYFPIAKWKDPRWNTLSVSEKTYLQELKLQIQEGDSKLPDYARLSVSTGDKMIETWYKLPAISKSSLERAYENPKDLIPAWINDSLTEQADDVEKGQQDIDESASEYRDELKKLGHSEIYASETGEERHGVPIFFRGKVKSSQQSFDLPSLVLMNNHMSENFKQKSLVAPALELALEVTGAKNLVKTSGLGKTIGINKMDTATASLIQGASSNEYKALKSILDDRLYGKSSIDLKTSATIFGVKVDANKAIAAVGSWTSNTMLMVNWLAGGVNLLQGKLSTFIEGVGSDVFDRSDLRSAEKTFWLDSKQWLNDVGSTLKKSKTNLLMELFNVSGDFNALSQRFSEDNRFKALMKKDTLFFTNHVGEFYIQSTMMYAALKSVKVQNKNKKWINAKGEVVKTEKEAASLDEMYTTKDGVLTLNSEVAFTNKHGGSPFTELGISNMLRKLSADLYGQYDPNMQSMAQRTAVGKLVFQLKKWLVRGVNRRWEGVQYSRKNVKDLRRIDRRYSEDSQAFEEGTYTTALRFIGQLFKSNREFQANLIGTDWSQLTDKEKSNIRKTVTEATLIALTLISGGLLKGLAEDEPDEDTANFLYTSAYIIRRTSSELSFYADPAETLRILKSPAASVSMLENVIELTGQLLTSPTERYKQGNRKNEYKFVKDLEDLVPIVKQTKRFDNMKETLGYIYK